MDQSTLRKYLHAVLISPTITVYAGKTLTEKVIRYFENPQKLPNLHLPTKLRQDTAAWELFEQKIGRELSSLRGEMVRKMTEDTAAKRAVDAVTKRQMVGLVAKAKHLTRFSFLRTARVKYMGLTATAQKNENYWAYVDRLLKELREGCANMTSSEKKAYYKQKFSDILNADLQAFPPADETFMTEILAERDSPVWQKEMMLVVGAFDGEGVLEE
ncbi:hypothetical protein SISSUDRAFT_1068112 [Sistotremastrum suecicum HHB10207 ss-3]|uniref:Uncharacterized protein n=1 Tax=Sistotremastrum suecicum HHB10207 ss-3 TaxID=1314776 RepID=A0A165WFD7_9AGAM|nr:hypothetical protein SISSUDRAFT_1068112 [Sistotremastrum suecicum HHB10207 ss-3]